MCRNVLRKKHAFQFSGVLYICIRQLEKRWYLHRIFVHSTINLLNYGEYLQFSKKFIDTSQTSRITKRKAGIQTI